MAEENFIHSVYSIRNYMRILSIFLDTPKKLTFFCNIRGRCFNFAIIASELSVSHYFVGVSREHSLNSELFIPVCSYVTKFSHHMT